jgi:hypothetical protein
MGFSEATGEHCSSRQVAERNQASKREPPWQTIPRDVSSDFIELSEQEGKSRLAI